MTYGSSNLTPVRGPSVWDRRGYDGRIARETMQRWAAGTAGLGLLLAGLQRHGKQRVWFGLAGGTLLAIAAGEQSVPRLRAWITRARSEDIVNQASNESFPASDAPSWTPAISSGSEQEPVNR